MAYFSADTGLKALVGYIYRFALLVMMGELMKPAECSSSAACFLRPAIIRHLPLVSLGGASDVLPQLIESREQIVQLVQRCWHVFSQGQPFWLLEGSFVIYPKSRRPPKSLSSPLQNAANLRLESFPHLPSVTSTSPMSEQYEI